MKNNKRKNSAAGFIVIDKMPGSAVRIEDIKCLMLLPNPIVYKNAEPGLWDIPKGRIDPGEDPHTAAVRELFEEAGIKINLANELDWLSFKYDWLQLYCCVYNGQVKISKNPKTGQIEHIMYNWVSIADAANISKSTLAKPIERFFNKIKQEYF